MSKELYDFLIGFLQYCAYGVCGYGLTLLYRKCIRGRLVWQQSSGDSVHTKNTTRDAEWWHGASFVSSLILALILTPLPLLDSALRSSESVYFVWCRGAILGISGLLFIALGILFFSSCVMLRESKS